MDVLLGQAGTPTGGVSSRMTGTPTGRASLFLRVCGSDRRGPVARCRDVSTCSIMETLWLVTCLSYKRCPKFSNGTSGGCNAEDHACGGEPREASQCRRYLLRTPRYFG